MSTLPSTLERARRAAGLSYKGWADRAQSNESYVNRICNGKAQPERDMVIRLCVGLGLHITDYDSILLAAGHARFSDSRRDMFIYAAAAEGLTVPTIHRLLVAVGLPGLLESSRRPKNLAGWGAPVATQPSSPNLP